MKVADLDFAPGIQASTKLIGRMLVELGNVIIENPEKAIVMTVVAMKIESLAPLLNILLATKVSPHIKANLHDKEFQAEVEEAAHTTQAVLTAAVGGDIENAFRELLNTRPDRNL